MQGQIECNTSLETCINDDVATLMTTMMMKMVMMIMCMTMAIMMGDGDDKHVGYVYVWSRL